MIYRYASINLEKSEYRLMYEIMQSIDSFNWDEDDFLEDFGPSPAKCRKQTVTMYSWSYIDPKKKGDDKWVHWEQTFLDREACETAGPKEWFWSKDKSLQKMRTFEVPTPSPHSLLNEVYNYIICSYFDRRVKGDCYGCANDRGSQIDHMSLGCLDDRENLIKIYGQACHEEIKPSSLMNALSFMCEQYKIKNTMSRSMIEKYYKEIDYKCVLKKPKDSYVNEMKKIDHI